MPSPQLRHSVRAPLAYLLLPLLAGYGLAGFLPAPPPGLALSAAGLLWLLALRTLVTPGNGTTTWPASFLGAATLVFWTYGSLALPAPPPSSERLLPPRESLVELCIERVFQAGADSGRASVVGRVCRAPPHSRLREGARLYSAFNAGELEAEVMRGATLAIRGVLRPIVEPEGTPAGRDFEAYLRDSGIYHALERGALLRVLSPPRLPLRFYDGMNQRIRRILGLGSPDAPGPASVYRAMLLGRKAELEAAQSRAYRTTGTMHFFAISGLHIGVIAGTLALSLKILRLPAPIRPLVALPLLYAYVQITGASPSAVRAFLMAAFFWCAHCFARQRSPVAALAASAVFVLLIDPTQFRSVGFQLSYAVVLAILLLGIPLSQALTPFLSPFRDVPQRELSRLERKLARAGEAFALLFAVSLSAWLASTPLSAAYFGIVSFSAILLNLILVHLAGLVIVTGMLSISLGLLSLEGPAAFINHAAWTVIHLMNGLVGAADRIPGTALTGLSCPPALAYAALTLFFLLLARAHRLKQAHRLHWLLPGPAALLLSLALGLIYYR